MAVDFANFLAIERANAIRWARHLLTQQNFVILDTETTGLDDSAEVCQVGILSPTGAVLLDTFVRPTIPIPPDATRIHGITDAMVANWPDFGQVGPKIRALVGDNDLVVYNLAYDRRILAQSAIAARLRWPPICSLARQHCAMEEYSRFYGQWNDYHQSFRWQRLPPVPGETAHSAIGDCKATLALIRRMAEATIPE
ncbi:MAG: 3'-5' exonuclease [Cyanobacteria bacterium REEB65]|nr:3'-5' exonuclease [Cyanobacteria bacterium REEB65]